MKFRSMLVAFLLLSGVFLLPVLSETPKQSAFAVPMGDWVIGPGESITIDGETIELKGNLTVESGGSLTLRGGSKLIMNSTYSGQYGIRVKEGGTLNVIDSEISAPEKEYKGKIRYDLSKGPNLISIPFERDNNSVENVLSPLKGHYYKAYVYDSSDQSDPWKFYTPGMKAGYADEIPSYTWEIRFGNRKNESVGPPGVLLTIPSNNTTSSTNQSLIVVFNQTMDTQAIPKIDVISGLIGTDFSFSGWRSTFKPNDTAIWTHSEWANDDDIVLRLYGYRNPEGYLGEDYSFSFHIEQSSAPKILKCTPEFGATAPVDGEITVLFDRSMNSSVIPKLTILNGTSPRTLTFKGWYSTNNSKDTAIWSYSGWEQKSTAVLMVSNYTDASDNAGPDFYLMFSIEDISPPSIVSTYPISHDSFVQTDSTVSVIFNESMNTSVTPILSQTGGNDTGNWTFLGWRSTYAKDDTASWSHNPWKDFDNITLTLFNYSDISGNYGSRYSWTFRTGDSRTPYVVSASPDIFDSFNPRNGTLKVRFNSEMNTNVIPEIRSSDNNISFNWSGWLNPYTASWKYKNATENTEIRITVSNYSDLSSIFPYQAILVYLYDNYSFELSGTVETAISQHMHEGWNMVAYPFIDNSTVESVFSSISSYYDEVKTYSNGSEIYLNRSDNISAGMGYWVHVNSDCLWYVSAYSLLQLESIFPKFTMVYDNGSSGNIHNSLISGCGYEGSDFSGISIFSDLVKVDGNRIRNSYAGIYVKDSSPIISNNEIYNEHYGIISENASAIISSNYIYSNREDGILVNGGYPIISSNKVYSNVGNGIALYDSNSIMETNDVEGNGGDGIVLYNSTATLDYSTIKYNKNGINSTLSNVSAERNTFEGNDVGFMSTNSTINLEKNTFSSNKRSVVADRVTEGKISNNSFISSDRSQILCINGSSPTIYGNIITSGDDGIYVSDSGPMIEKNIIGENRGNGVHLQGGSESRIRNNVIMSNGWAGIYVDGSYPLIENNSIYSNDFGIATFNSTCRIKNGTLNSNRWYGMSFIYSDVFVENTSLIRNKWYGILTSYSEFSIQNVSIYNSTYQLYLTHSSRGNSINSTVEYDKCHLDASSWLYVKFFLNINVEDAFGNGISGVNYTIEDRDGYKVMEGGTRYGKGFYIPLTSYMRIFGGTIDTENPYNLTVTWNNQTFQRTFYMNSTVYENFTFNPKNYSVNEDCGKRALFNVSEWIPVVENSTFAVNGSYYTRGYVDNYTFYIDPVRNWNGVEFIRLSEMKNNTTIGTYTFYIDVIPVNDAPELEGGTAYISGNEVVFKVTYIDVDNDAPQYIRVVIDGKSHDMTPLYPGDIDYSDGEVYIYKAPLKEGPHKYYFECSDGMNTTKVQQSEIEVKYPLSVPMWVIYALIFAGLLLVLGVGIRIRKLKKMAGEDIDISIGEEKKAYPQMMSTIDTRRRIWKRSSGLDTKSVGLDRSMEAKSSIDSVESAPHDLPMEANSESAPSSEPIPAAVAKEEKVQESAEDMSEPETEEGKEKKRKYTRNAFMELTRKHRKMRVLLEDREKYAKLEPEVEESEGVGKEDESVDEILKTIKGD